MREERESWAANPSTGGGERECKVLFFGGGSCWNTDWVHMDEVMPKELACRPDDAPCKEK